MNFRRFAIVVAAFVSFEGRALGETPVRDASLVEVSAFLGVGATALAVDVFAPGVATPRWTGPILFDAAARDALSAKTSDGRARAALASDVGIAFLVARPLTDATFATLFGKLDSHTAFELSLTDLEAFSVTEALTTLSKRAFGRQRPEAEEAGCDRGDATADGSTICTRKDRNASFLSGHTSLAFTSASLVCTEHARIAFYGEPLDTLTCFAAITAAMTTGAFRIVADRHWASDVIAGATIGSLSGWLVPTLFRFRSAKRDAIAIVPVATPVVGGIAIGVAGVAW